MNWLWGTCKQRFPVDHRDEVDEDEGEALEETVQSSEPMIPRLYAMHPPLVLTDRVIRFGAYHLAKRSEQHQRARQKHGSQTRPGSFIHIGNILTRLFQYGVRMYLDSRDPSWPEYL